MEYRCSKCKTKKPRAEFHKSRAKKHGITSQCKTCRRRSNEEWRAAHRDKIRAYAKLYSAANKGKLRDYTRQWRRDNREASMVQHAKNRAERGGLPFNIDVSDIVIPVFCPVLGLQLSQSHDKQHDASPSLDRLIPALGYVKGNVRVISWRANNLKRDATAEELIALGRDAAKWRNAIVAGL